MEPTWNYAVQLSAVVQESPPQITLNWVQDTSGTPYSYTVSRKAPGDTTWGPGVWLSGSATSYTDTSVSVGVPYEYQVQKSASGYNGYGYIYSGIKVPLVENRGKLLLIVDNTYAANLVNELAQLQQDLAGDGWTVIRQDVSRYDTVSNIKALIQGQYWADPANVKMVFLFGHVPVPYSGDIAPDEHPEHMGAWPADTYYGDIDNDWTDYSVNDTQATSSRNWNTPGDGKFDQSLIPSTVELMVGRVDLANMPGRQTWNGPATFPSEPSLLQQYLNKDHTYRRGWMNLPRRGLVGDYFGLAAGAGFAASGWRNFAPFFGPQNITSLPNQGTWLNQLKNNAYLWAYGCGPGQYNSISGLGTSGAYYYATTTDLVAANPQAVFYMLYGSWLGDFDSEDDFQRAVLATPSYGLACCWSGSPHWFLQHMALGETIGYSTRLTQNNGNGLYYNQVATYPGEVDVCLMGDPALRMNVVQPVSNLSGSAGIGTIQLSWTGSTDPVLGYHVYRTTTPAGPFTRMNSSLLTGTTYTDSIPATGTYTYMVRAVLLQTTPSGSYYNASTGAFITVAGTAPPLRTGVHVDTISIGPAGVVLSWTSLPGATYTVSSTISLVNGTWSDLSPNINAGGTTSSWTDATAPGAGQRFYRVFRIQ